MLSAALKLGVEEMLSEFDENLLFALTETVTGGLLKNKIESRLEAINAILNYSPDVISILKRKAITREILCCYLFKKNISIKLPATKNDLIQRILDFWNHQEFTTTSTETNFNTADCESIAILAEQFSNWFYSNLNSNESINYQHFYADAKLQINMFNNGQITSEYVENNPQEIAQKLFLLKMTYNLVFNPNLSKEGVQGRVDPHGLVIVLVCGTLHSNSVCVGIFEQVFALVRDPLSENNWKIKNTELNLKNQSRICALPTLPPINS